MSGTTTQVAPQLGAGTAPGQPPAGQSTLASPTPNRGMEAKGLSHLRVVVRQLEVILPMLGAATPAGKEVMKALTSLAKLTPAGQTSSGIENTSQQELMMAQKSQAPILAALRAQQQGGASGSGMPPPGGAPPAPEAPQPSPDAG